MELQENFVSTLSKGLLMKSCNATSPGSSWNIFHWCLISWSGSHPGSQQKEDSKTHDFLKEFNSLHWKLQLYLAKARKH